MSSISWCGASTRRSIGLRRWLMAPVISAVRLRTTCRPVASLRNELDELSRDSRLDAASRERINQAIERIDEMLATFSALLRLARIEAGSFGPRHDNVDLHALWQDAVDLYEAVAV